ncbi:SKN1-domain-containing protein, partial [Testicularia cyperi]
MGPRPMSGIQSEAGKARGRPGQPSSAGYLTNGSNAKSAMTHTTSADGSSNSSGHQVLQTSATAWLYQHDGSPEDDDWLHQPEAKTVAPNGTLPYLRTHICNGRGMLNVSTLLVLLLAIMMLFAGYPLLSVYFFYRERPVKTGFGLGGSNGTGQVPSFDKGFFQLIDADTPSSAYNWANPIDSASYHLVFSDEFEVDGRTFWPGDDPFWEAVDLHYWVTGDYEWYSPEAVNTSHGFLNIWMEEMTNHNLNFRSGMVQSWNKFCFQGGYIETSIILPGSHSSEGFWPAAWLLGNLGRAGYAGTTQGMWPYSYKSCDVGTLANQTVPDKSGPEAAINAHGLYSAAYDHKLSFLEGQRLSACTCQGEDHPGPSVSIGRSAPELDIIEAQVNSGHGGASQSLQVAPFDANYSWNQEISTLHQTDSVFNSYTGGIYQEAVSGVSPIPDAAYSLSGGKPTTFGVFYEPDWTGDGSGSVTWYIDGVPRWTLPGKALGPNPATEIGQRIIPTEPLSIVLNLALSDGFQRVKWDGLPFPASLKFDYVRVYQKDGQQDRISCDPDDHPTAKYIHDHLDVYMNPNYTVFPQDKY